MNRFSKDCRLLGRSITEKLFDLNSGDACGVCLHTRANCHQSVASACCCTNDCVIPVHHKVLFEDIQGA